MKEKMKLIMHDKKKRAQLLLLVVSTVILMGTVSFAYFSAMANNDKAATIDGTTAFLKLRFADGDNGINGTIAVGETVTKKFLIENTGTAEASLSIDWVDMINTYMINSLSYRLTYSETEDGEYQELLPYSNIPTSDEPLKQTLAGEVSVPAGEIYYYNLDITYNDLPDVDQSPDIGATFTTVFDTGQPIKYRYYTLSVDPNGGEWEGSVGVQEFLLQNRVTKEISTPTREGYTFDGWEMSGKSSAFSENVFTMGIGDTTLKARWNTNKYTVTIDGEEREMSYGESIDLGTPVKEGYTFTGWNTTAGVLNGTIYTVTSSDAVITAEWTINNYRYIIYHNQMNTDGNGYTLVSADTDEGEAAFNTVVNPEVKTYTGFTSPVAQSLTIKAEEVYPPVKNKIDYNYTRNQYTLSIDSNGGTYSGQTSQSLYYDQSMTIDSPTRTGYNFTNWTASSGDLSGTTYTMGASDATITANWAAKQFSVTFNANGGTTSTPSKTVTYDSTYGDLPTPEYTGYIFLGWYTSSSEGTRVTSSTMYTALENQTLYAHWEKAVYRLMARGGNNYNEKLWEQKSNITKLVFENTINPKTNAAYTYDISDTDSNGKTMAYLVPNSDATTYTAYIQANGEIIANPDSSYWFADFSKLQSIEGLENLDTNQVTNLLAMFKNCGKLTTLDLSSFDTSNVTNMANMFEECRSLTTLNVSNFNTSNVTNMVHMFYGCLELTALDVSNFDTSNVTDMSGMFEQDGKITVLDVSNFNTSKVIWIDGMFSNCSGLTTLDVSNFDTSNVTDMSSMFYWCTNLTTLDLSNFDTSKVTNMSYMFSRCSSLTTLDLSSFDTSNVIDMSSMFDKCLKLTALDVSNFNTGKVYNMSKMFRLCTSITTLDLRSFNTSRVTNMESMFNMYESMYLMDTSLLTALDISSFNTSNVTNMANMFYDCIKLESLDVSNFNTSKVTRMDGMFYKCKKLTTLNLSNFDTSKVTNMASMFYWCDNLTILDVSNFNTSNVTDMSSMFYWCDQLTTLDLNNFNTDNVIDMSSMFERCFSLKTTITIKGTKCTSYSNMFTNAAWTTSGGSITVNYTSDTSSLVDSMIATKSSDSNVIKGSLVS